MTRAGPLRIGDVVLPQRVLYAPMTGISDLPFRETAAHAGAVYTATEMVASDAFVAGRADVLRRAAVGEGLPLSVMQLLGRSPAPLARAARLAEAAGADLIDINMGCPAKEVVGGRCGAALMRDLDLAQQIVAAVVDAVSRPVTVKMRLGWGPGELTAIELARRAERAGAAAVTVHGRSRAAFYSGVADPSAVRAVKAAVSIPVIVNGDVFDAASARAALAASGADAVMLGRAAVGRPWLAASIEGALQGSATDSGPDPAARLDVALGHFARALRFYGDAQGLRLFRKHLAAYVEHAPGMRSPVSRRAARAALCRLEDPRDIERALRRWWFEDLTAA